MKSESLIKENQIIKKLFGQYNSNYKKLKGLLLGNIPRSLRVFDIRFRLALDIQIDFNGEVSYTKTKEVRETYILITKLMETWNAYEALFHYVKNLDKLKVSIYQAYSETFLSEVGSLGLLKNILDNLKSEYKTKQNFRNDFDQYIYRIQKDDKIKPKLTTKCFSTLEYFKDEKVISGIEIIALIYAERNMYYHNGETAKMGMKYSNRQILIKSYLYCLTEHTLKLTNYILDKEIKESKNATVNNISKPKEKI